MRERVRREAKRERERERERVVAKVRGWKDERER